MKPSSIVMLSMLSTLLFSISLATPDPAQDAFVQCLKDQASQSPKPISEAIYTPENANFLNRFYVYFRNGRFKSNTTRMPAAIVTAMHESHVQATVICAKNHSLNLRIRSGGHDSEGQSYVSNEPFVLLDMFNLRSIDIDIASDTAWVQAGATLGELYHTISQKSKTHAFPGGVCFSVATGGHFIGAGYGNMLRKYGLSVDNIVDALIVDVNGKILNRESMGEDVFWAIRGGGASFAVILSWKIKLVPVPEIVTFFQVEKTLEQGLTDIVYRWQEVASELPEDIFIRLQIQPAQFGQGGNSIKAIFLALYLGKSETLLPMMNERFPDLGLQQKDCVEASWIETTLYFERYPKGTSLDILLDRQPFNMPSFKVKSDYVKAPIPKAALEELWKKSIEAGVLIMQWNPYGGRMNQISESETPFPHRKGNKFKIQYWFMGSLESLQKVYDFMTPYVSQSPREAFLNYRDLDVGTNQNGANSSNTFGASYFKGNFERLMQVKTKIDPGNFFRNEQTIPPLPT